MVERSFAEFSLPTVRHSFVNINYLSVITASINLLVIAQAV